VPRYRLTRAADGDIAAIFLTGVEIFGQAQADAYHTGMAETFAFSPIIRVRRVCAPRSCRRCALGRTRHI